MTPEQRRADIVAAALPLLREHGKAVTTRQIADAAGVGEGTIFRVFGDKSELIEAVVMSACDPRPGVSALSEIDPGAPLAERLVEIVRITQQRVVSLMTLLTALGRSRPPEEYRPPPGESRAARFADLAEAISALIEADRDRLRVSPSEFTRLLRIVTIAASHPGITDAQPMSAEEIVDLLLHGALRQDGAPPC